MKMKIALLYGGKSAEHEVSLLTAKAIIGALNRDKFEIYPIYINKEGIWIQGEKLGNTIDDVSALVFSQTSDSTSLPALLAGASEQQPIFDIVFPLLHGPNGEDGTVQGVLELLNLPYVGNGVFASAAGMDKVMTKRVLSEVGLRQAAYTHYLRSEWSDHAESCYVEVEERLGYPCFVKPANLGSSVGISKCENRAQLIAGFDEAFRYDRKIVVEEMIRGREIELGVLGNDRPACSVAGELIIHKDFYDYTAKYVDGKTEMVIPAPLPDGVYDEMERMAKDAFLALDCAGLIRADFFLSDDGLVYLNEVNTMPGCTPFSMFPSLWGATGVGYSELIETLVDLGIERHKEKQLIKFSY